MLGCCKELLPNQQTNIPIACENLKVLLERETRGRGRGEGGGEGEGEDTLHVGHVTSSINNVIH